MHTWTLSWLCLDVASVFEAILFHSIKKSHIYYASVSFSYPANQAATISQASEPHLLMHVNAHDLPTTKPGNLEFFRILPIIFFEIISYASIIDHSFLILPRF